MEEETIPWKFILVLVAPEDKVLPSSEELATFNLRLADLGPPGTELVVSIFGRDEVPLTYKPLYLSEEEPSWNRMPKFKDEVRRTFLVVDFRFEGINIYDYSYNLGWEELAQSWFLLPGEKKVVNSDLLEEWASYILDSPYDGPRKLGGPTYTFSGQKIPEYVSAPLVKIIKDYHANMADYVSEWLKAGFDEKPGIVEHDYAREIDKRTVDRFLESKFKEQITKAEIEYARSLPRDELKDWIFDKLNQVFGTVDKESILEVEKLGLKKSYNTVAISETAQLPGWAVQTQTPAFKQLIWTYGLVSNVPDVDVQAMFLSNDQYRRKVLEAMQATVANFVINNRTVGVADVAKLGGWTNPETYTQIAKKLRK